MMRIAAIGNSHLGAVKMAAQHFPHDFTFFAARGGELGKVVTRDGVLVMPEELRSRIDRMTGTGSVIDPVSFDGFLLVGAALGLGNVVRSLIGFRPFALARPQYSLISDACVEAVVRALVQSTAAANLTRQIRALSDAPIAIVPAPFFAAGYGAMATKQSRQFQEFMDSGWLPAVSAIYQAEIDRLSGALDTPIVAQPAETLRPDLLTHDEYSIEAQRVRRGGPATDPDYVHMGEDYGRLVLATALEAIEARTLQPA